MAPPHAPTRPRVSTGLIGVIALRPCARAVDAVRGPPPRAPPSTGRPKPSTAVARPRLKRPKAIIKRPRAPRHRAAAGRTEFKLPGAARDGKAPSFAARGRRARASIRVP